jgi:hypothetical protein
VVWPGQLAADIERIVTVPGAIDFAGGVMRLLECRLGEDRRSPPRRWRPALRGALIVAVKRCRRLRGRRSCRSTTR